MSNKHLFFIESLIALTLVLATTTSVVRHAIAQEEGGAGGGDLNGFDPNGITADGTTLQDILNSELNGPGVLPLASVEVDNLIREHLSLDEILNGQPNPLDLVELETFPYGSTVVGSQPGGSIVAAPDCDLRTNMLGCPGQGNPEPDCGVPGNPLCGEGLILKSVPSLATDIVPNCFVDGNLDACGSLVGGLLHAYYDAKGPYFESGAVIIPDGRGGSCFVQWESGPMPTCPN